MTRKRRIIIHSFASNIFVVANPFVGAPYSSKEIGSNSQTTPSEETSKEVVLSRIIFPFSLKQLEILSPQDFPNVHPLVLNLFPIKMSEGHPLAGRTRHFLKSWQKLTNDQAILQIVQIYQIPFVSKPFQRSAPKPPHLKAEEKKLVDQEIKEMLSKGAIEKAQSSQDQFLSNVFLVSKKDGETNQ